MRISGIDNKSNFTAGLYLGGETKNLHWNEMKNITQTADKIGTSKDRVHIEILQASDRSLEPELGFYESMARIKFKTNINNKKEAFILSSPNETNCIKDVLNSLAERFPE